MISQYPSGSASSPSPISSQCPISSSCPVPIFQWSACKPSLRIGSSLLFAFFLFIFVLPTCAQPLFVGSYNIRYKNRGDYLNGDAWERRCPVVCGQLNFEQPDIFGAQEVLHEQLTDMLALLDGYDYIGCGRDDGDKAGEYAAIFFRKDRVQLLDQGHFWLSPTPEKPGLGWDAACVRICTWGYFKNRDTKMKFYFFNLHMDHVGTEARRESAHLVVRKIREIAKNAPVILTGDFNVDQHDEIYSIFTNSGILKDSFTNARHRFAENGTYNAYNPYVKTSSRIDHVFVSPRFIVNNYGLLTNAYWVEDRHQKPPAEGYDMPSARDAKNLSRRLPSDHYPVFVRLSWQ